MAEAAGDAGGAEAEAVAEAAEIAEAFEIAGGAEVSEAEIVELATKAKTDGRLELVGTKWLDADVGIVCCENAYFVPLVALLSKPDLAAQVSMQESRACCWLESHREKEVELLADELCWSQRPLDQLRRSFELLTNAEHFRSAPCVHSPGLLVAKALRALRLKKKTLEAAGSPHLLERREAEALAALASEPQMRRAVEEATKLPAYARGMRRLPGLRLGPAALRRFLAVLRAGEADGGEPAAGAPTTLTLPEVNAWGARYATAEAEALGRLRAFAPYIDALDLSRTYVVGPAISYALIRTPCERRSGPEAYLKECYPVAYWQFMKQGFWGGRIEVETFGNSLFESLTVARKPGRENRLYRTRGVPLVLRVDAETEEEFDRVALEHYRAIRSVYPVVLKRAESDWFVEPAADGARFRRARIQWAPGGFGGAVSGRIDAERGAFSAAGSASPRFLLTPHLAHCMETLEPDGGCELSPNKAYAYCYRGYSCRKAGVRPYGQMSEAEYAALIENELRVEEGPAFRWLARRPKA